MTTLVESRSGHMYEEERVTPVSEIPLEFQKEAPLVGGGTQVIDTRLTYNWEPGSNGTPGRLVECGSVASHADQQGFESPEKE